MLTSIRSLMAATIFAGSAFVATPALAQTGEIMISGNAAIVTQYRFRGQDLSGGDFAVQGGVDVGHASGFYAGVWGSSIDEDTLDIGHTELNFYGGWGGELTDGLSADVGVLAYVYPNAGPGDFDIYELYGSLGFTFGPAQSSIGLAYAPKQDSLGGDDNLYIYVDLGVGVPNTPVTLSGHVGYTDGALTFTDDGDAWDWSIGADYAINRNLAIGVAYVGSEGDYLPGDYRFTRDAVVGTLSASF